MFQERKASPFRVFQQCHFFDNFSHQFGCSLMFSALEALLQCFLSTKDFLWVRLPSGTPVFESLLKNDLSTFLKLCVGSNVPYGISLFIA